MHALARNHHRSAAPIRTGGVQHARHMDRAVAAGQDDLALALFGRAGLDHAAHVHRAVHQPLGRDGRHPHPAAVGEDLAGVGRQGVGRLAVLVAGALGDGLVHRDVDALVAVEVHDERPPRRQMDLAQPRDDGPVVGDARGDQRDEPGLRHRDGALVHHHGVVVGGALETVAAGQEILVADVAGGGEKARHVDLRVGSEHDPVGVDEPDLPIGGQPAQDLRHGVAHHAVEHDGVRRGLLEMGVLARADGEVAPLDDGLVGGLADLQRVGGRLVDGGVPGDHPPAFRVGRRRRRPHRERQPRRTCERRGLAEEAGEGRAAGHG